MTYLRVFSIGGLILSGCASAPPPPVATADGALTIPRAVYEQACWLVKSEAQSLPDHSSFDNAKLLEDGGTILGLRCRYSNLTGQVAFITIDLSQSRNRRSAKFLRKYLESIGVIEEGQPGS
jgi:hypothetical protein